MDLSELLIAEGRFELGVTAERLPLTTREENRLASLALVRQAHKTLNIVSRELDGPLYSNTRFVDAVTALARHSRQSRIRVLIHSSEAIVRHGHLLVERAQRLASSIRMRRLGETVQDYAQAFLIADGRGVLHRPYSDLYDGTVNFNDPARARALTRRFEELWEHSAPDPELQRLEI